jgi:hypothetical protein
VIKDNVGRIIIPSIYRGKRGMCIGEPLAEICLVGCEMTVDFAQVFFTKYELSKSFSWSESAFHGIIGKMSRRGIHENVNM